MCFVPTTGIDPAMIQSKSLLEVGVSPHVTRQKFEPEIGGLGLNKNRALTDVTKGADFRVEKCQVRLKGSGIDTREYSVASVGLWVERRSFS